VTNYGKKVWTKANQGIVNDEFSVNYSPPHYLDRNLLAAMAFAGLLLMVFVGLWPFSPPTGVAAYGGIDESSSGNSLRQISYLTVFSLILLTALRQRGWAAMRSVPLSFILLLAWCALSASWAAEPGVVLRRAALEIVVVLSVFLSVGTIGADRAFKMWRILLAIILVVNWISIPLIATAVHLPGESDVALIGNWRGLYGHKNIAGAVCAVTALLFLFSKNGKGNWIGILVAIGATGFLIMSHSKSSLGFLPLALLSGILYRAGWRDGLSRAILTVLALILFFLFAIFVSLEAQMLTKILEDPAEFTGRAAIWQAEVSYIKDHLLLGAGYGTFADTGGLSPLHNYVSDKWVEAVSHGHNGYLQILVTIGGIGFFLAAVAVIATPVLRFWKLDRGQPTLKPLLFALFVFSIFHNLMESDFLEGDAVIWATFLLMLAGLKELEERQYSTRTAANRPSRYPAARLAYWADRGM
jgi:exopolysaccharide production protein ExoQ